MSELRKWFDENYFVDEHGAIVQKDPKPFVYDCEYSKIRYDNIKRATEDISLLRYTYLCSMINRTDIESWCDVGYGNSAMLKFLDSMGVRTYGVDVPTVEDPLIGTRISLDQLEDLAVDVVSFYDSLEHMHNIDFLAKLKCDYIVISLPWLPINSEVLDDDNLKIFQDWKHRRPDEHVRHFDKYNLNHTMKNYNWHMIGGINIEDIIRKSNLGYPNILSAVFSRWS